MAETVRPTFGGVQDGGGDVEGGLGCWVSGSLGHWVAGSLGRWVCFWLCLLITDLCHALHPQEAQLSSTRRTLTSHSIMAETIKLRHRALGQSGTPGAHGGPWVTSLSPLSSLLFT